jgi:hypothetical protein
MPTPHLNDDRNRQPVAVGRIPEVPLDEPDDRASRLARFHARRAAARPLTPAGEALIAELLAGADERLAQLGIFPVRSAD